MNHSRRTTLTTDDIDSALKLRNVEVKFQIYVLIIKTFLFLIEWFVSELW